MRTFGAVVTLCLMLNAGVVAIGAQDQAVSQDIQPTPAKWENGKVVTTRGMLYSMFLGKDGYILHHPRGGLNFRENNELYKLEGGVLKVVKDDAGSPLRLTFPIGTESGQGFYVVARASKASPEEKTTNMIWWIDGLKASAVKAGGEILRHADIDISANGWSAAQVGKGAEAKIYRLDKAEAKHVMDLGAHVPAGSTIDFRLTATDTLLLIDDGKKSDSSVGLFRLASGAAAPVKTPAGTPLRSRAVGMFQAGSNCFVWTINSEKSQKLWRYTGGAVAALKFPDANPDDQVAILGMRVFGDKLVLSRWPGTGETDFQWIVGAGDPTPVKTAAGKHLGGWSVSWSVAKTRLIAEVCESEETEIGTLWSFDGTTARPIVDSGGVQLRGQPYVVASVKDCLILRESFDDSGQYRLAVVRGVKAGGHVIGVDGKPLTDYGFSTYSTESEFYVQVKSGDQTQMYYSTIK